MVEEDLTAKLKALVKDILAITQADFIPMAGCVAKRRTSDHAFEKWSLIMDEHVFGILDEDEVTVCTYQWGILRHGVEEYEKEPELLKFIDFQDYTSPMWLDGMYREIKEVVFKHLTLLQAALVSTGKRNFNFFEPIRFNVIIDGKDETYMLSENGFELVSSIPISAITIEGKLKAMSSTEFAAKRDELKGLIKEMMKEVKYGESIDTEGKEDRVDAMHAALLLHQKMAEKSSLSGIDLGAKRIVEDNSIGNVLLIGNKPRMLSRNLMLYVDTN